ncbi:MAG: hypothetical protein RL748_2066, partial [Pseudomonadota bacterium]
MIDRATPVVVQGFDPGDGPVAVAAGYKHTCALTTCGRVKCWGSNVEGALGNGNNINNTRAVSVLGIADARTISAGSYHSCAGLLNGTAKCWGYGGYGQLGNLSTANSNVPVVVSGLSNVKSMVGGIYHSCALTTAGAVKCWGENSRGQLGNGSTSGSTVPVNVVGLSSGAAQLAAGSAGHSNCVILAAGGGQCWGANGNWQLGSGDNLNKTVPTAVVGLSSNPQFIALGWGDSCAGVSSGVQCRGTLNAFGEHGAGNSATVTFPQNTVGFVADGPATKPVAISPITQKLPVYTWQPVSGATSYRLQIDGMDTI